MQEFGTGFKHTQPPWARLAKTVARIRLELPRRETIAEFFLADRDRKNGSFHRVLE